MLKSAFKGAAAAAGLAFAALASPAFALTEIHITNTAMNTHYTATIHYAAGGSETAYSNGVDFTAYNVGGNPADTFDLFGFCIDVFHNISLGHQNLTYESTYNDPAYTDLPTTDFGNPALTLSEDQRKRISSLVDIGFILHRDNPGNATVNLQTAAIQAAIWDTILSVPGHDRGYVTVNNGGAHATPGGETFQQYFDYYRTTPLSGDRIFEIYDKYHDPSHQAFAVGWPQDAVPEPASWALMILGFGAAGAVLRRRQAALA